MNPFATPFFKMQPIILLVLILNTLLICVKAGNCGSGMACSNGDEVSEFTLPKQDDEIPGTQS